MYYASIWKNWYLLNSVSSRKCLIILCEKASWKQKNTYSKIVPYYFRNNCAKLSNRVPCEVKGYQGIFQLRKQWSQGEEHFWALWMTECTSALWMGNNKFSRISSIVTMKKYYVSLTSRPLPNHIFCSYYNVGIAVKL